MKRIITLFVILNLFTTLYSQEKKDFSSQISKVYPYKSITEEKKFPALYSTVARLPKDSVKRYHKYLNYLLSEESLQNKIKGKAIGGFNGDIAGEQELIRVSFILTV